MQLSCIVSAWHKFRRPSQGPVLRQMQSVPCHTHRACLMELCAFTTIQERKRASGQLQQARQS